MQVEGLLFMLLMLVVFPMMILSSNPTVFFIIVGVVLFLSSLNTVWSMVFWRTTGEEDEPDELTDEVEETVNIDVKKFGAGTRVVKDLVVILFFIYCSFFIHIPWMKVLLALILAYRLKGMAGYLIPVSQAATRKDSLKLNSFVSILMNLSTALMIILVTYSKFRF